MLLGVAYHYVARKRPSSPTAIHPITLDDFAVQLDLLGRDFDFVSRDDLLTALDGSPLPARSCVITFDDGLRRQVELALPVLEQRGIPAIFFVSSQPLTDRRVAYVHKVHLLREQLGDDELRTLLRAELEARGLDPARLERARPPEMYPYDPPEAAALKYLLNFVLGPTDTTPVDAVFARSFDETAVCRELYAGADDIRELEARGALGAHGDRHIPLARLGPEAARDDLARSAAALTEVVGRPVRTMSYPYGTADAVDQGVAAAAAASGFRLAFTMERAVNASLDEPLLLARLDTNDAPGGRRACIDVSAGTMHVEHPVTNGRRRYLVESAA
jgi:peptidoglycan/xylan/chitin deacetylase (PgdA/CDA1 family)